MSSKNLNPFKDFQSDQIQRSSRKILTAHYACRNAALNLTPVTGRVSVIRGRYLRMADADGKMRIEKCG